jgi:hypothetical protein
MDKDLELKLKNSTPVYQSIEKFEDADDEMLFIANHIKRTTQHNEYIEPSRIKFLYSNKPKKDGSSYSLFDLFKRNDMDKMIDDSYDFILTIFYDVWKDLEPEQKIMMLDKALCGIDMGGMESQKVGKNPPDSKEYKANMRFYGADKIMNTSDIVDLACRRILEEKKEQQKLAREGKQGKKNKNKNIAEAEEA